MKLREFKTKWVHYYIDDNDLHQGEYKEWHDTNILYLHYFCKDNLLHGEFKKWNRDGKLIEHSLYIYGEKYIFLINDISPEDKLLLSIKHELQWLQK